MKLQHFNFPAKGVARIYICLPSLDIQTSLTFILSHLIPDLLLPKEVTLSGPAPGALAAATESCRLCSAKALNDENHEISDDVEINANLSKEVKAKAHPTDKN